MSTLVTIARSSAIHYPMRYDSTRTHTHTHAHTQLWNDIRFYGQRKGALMSWWHSSSCYCPFMSLSLFVFYHGSLPLSQLQIRLLCLCPMVSCFVFIVVLSKIELAIIGIYPFEILFAYLFLGRQYDFILSFHFKIWQLSHCDISCAATKFVCMSI